MPDIPAVWETDPIEVFTGTGMSRFRQEIDSANQLMAQLNRGQEAVAQQARNTDLFPPEMFQDLNRLAVRIDAVRSRIQAIESNPVNIGTDAANAELERLRGQLAPPICGYPAPLRIQNSTCVTTCPNREILTGQSRKGKAMRAVCFK